jgi:hypothetical protein
MLMPRAAAADHAFKRMNVRRPKVAESRGNRRKAIQASETDSPKQLNTAAFADCARNRRVSAALLPGQALSKQEELRRRVDAWAVADKQAS